MLIGSQDLIVRLSNGKALREYYHEGNQFIEGRKGSGFEIVVKNRSYNKIKAIVSVDGLCVIDGKPAGSDSQGYVVGPNGEAVIKGWRVSNTAVNEFYFSSRKQSYTSRVGEGNANIGVIGLMVFNQEIAYQTISYNAPVTREWLSPKTSDWKGWQVSTSDCDGYGIATASAGVGTGFGQELNAPVMHDYTNFKSTPENVMVLYYDDREGLERRGIVVDEKKAFPNAFPSYSSGKYAKRPI